MSLDITPEEQVAGLQLIEDTLKTFKRNNVETKYISNLICKSVTVATVDAFKDNLEQMPQPNSLDELHNQILLSIAKLAKRQAVTIGQLFQLLVEERSKHNV